MISRYSLVSASLLFSCTLASAMTPCDVLRNGNTEYEAKRFDSALTLYIYTILGRDAVKEPPVALAHHKNASKYNRAFANALMCSAGDCKGSEEFWAKLQDFYK
jgi:hypothetical protein